jgi:hypothetical protein
MSAFSTGKVYFALEGPDSEIALKPWNSLFVGPWEQRAIANRTNMPASMLVVIDYPE